MRILEVNYCNECPFYGTEMEEKEVSDDYKGNYYTTNNDKQKKVDELICYCLKKEKGYMVPIKNLGVELTELMYGKDNSAEEENRISVDYRSKLKIKIPKWCPLTEKG